jgi:peptidyl-prolyl cis-trans isomerase SurA
MMICALRNPPRFPRFAVLCACALALILALVPTRDAAAQALVATVNDDPITTYDIEQRLKLLKVLKRPVTADTALEAIIADRLRLREFKKYNLPTGIGERNNGIFKIAGEMKTSPQGLMTAVQAAGVPEKHWADFFTAEAGWQMMTRALNKGLEVSEKEVRAELARRGDRKQSATEYILRPIVLILPIGATPDAIQKRLRDAQQLRQRFTDCASGLPLVRAMPETAVKEQFSRAGASVSAEMRDILEKIPVGQLTEPTRAATGIEMIAVCSKIDARDDKLAGEDVRNELLGRKLEALGAKSLADLRKRAIVVKR